MNTKTMNRLSRSILFLLAGISPMLAAGPAQAEPVLMISIDGLRPGDVLQARQRGLRLPNLEAFLRSGAYAENVRGVLPTLTYPSHTTMVTGVPPGEHHIASNYKFDPYYEMPLKWYRDAADIAVPTLWDAAHAAGLSTANVDWPVTVGAAGIDWNLPQTWPEADDAKVATPGLLPTLEKQLGPYVPGTNESITGDENRAKFAVRLLEMHKPYFMTAYLCALDEAEHTYGPDTPQARRTLERIDALVGKLVAAARRVHPDGAIVLVSDHGFVPVQHDANLFVPFIQAGLMTVKDGRIVDWQAEPWHNGGSAAIVLRDPADAAAKAKTAALLAQLQDNPAFGIDHIEDHAQVLAQGGVKEAEWFVQFRPGYEMAFTLDTPIPSHGSHDKGMHGYDPALPQMRSTLLLIGTNVPRGRNLGEVDMRDIAPTVAGLLGVSLPRAQGHDVLTSSK